MRLFFQRLAVLIVSIVVSVLVIRGIAYPILLAYPKLAHVMTRYSYTQATLIIFMAVSLWLFYIQLQMRKFSAVYVYLFYSVYLFLLFVVLFVKSSNYHALILNPFDFLVWDRVVILEALLNVGYFIPLGALYGMRANKFEFVVIALATFLGIETLQYVFYLGTFAISDILLNFVGSTSGYALCMKLRRYLN